MAKLLNVDKAIELILESIQQGPSETLTATEARGRVLARDVIAAVDLPPFANSAVDGYALRSTDLTHETFDRALQVVMDIRAGVMPKGQLGPGEAARIMTGAPVPEGADCVIPVEDTDSAWADHPDAPAPEQVRLTRQPIAGDNIRPRGENVQRGATVLKAGTVIRAPEIGILAALGHGEVDVVKKPRVAILSTGDELIGINDPLIPGKIRDINGYTLAALIEENGGIPIRLPTAPDEPEAIRALFQQAIALQPEMIVSSAGVSIGAADYIRAILEEHGIVDFWRINLRPGKPLAYGHIQNIPFFGLPGNPVSAMVTFDVLVRPALLRIGAYPDNASYSIAHTGEKMYSDGRRSYVRVRLEQDGDRLIAYETGTQSSGALMSMVLADGLLVIPEDVKVVEAGTALTVKLLRAVP